MLQKCAYINTEGVYGHLSLNIFLIIKRVPCRGIPLNKTFKVQDYILIMRKIQIVYRYIIGKDTIIIIGKCPTYAEQKYYYCYYSTHQYKRYIIILHERKKL